MSKIEIGLLILLFLIKILDNVIMAVKSIATNKGNIKTSSSLTVVSQLMFYFVINKVLSGNTILSIAVVSVGSGIGNAIGMKIADRFGKDIMFMNVLTCSDKENISGLYTYLKDNNIKSILFPCVTRKFKDSYALLIFSMTRNESKAIDIYIEGTDTLYMRKIIK